MAPVSRPGRGLYNAVQLAGVIRIGCIARLLQALRKTFRVQTLRHPGHQFRIARVAAQHIGIITESIRVGGISADLLHAFMGYAVDVFRLYRFHYRPFPVAAGLLAEEVMAGLAVSPAELPFTPSA